MSDTPLRNRVLVDITISAAADEVWAALRDAEKIAQWFGWDGPGAAAEIQTIFFDYAEADDGQRILRFKGVSDRFEVAEASRGATLKVVRTYPAGENWEDVFEEMTEGWVTFVQQLKLALEGHRGQRRRVLHLFGTALEPAARPRKGLGIDVGARIPGDLIVLASPSGDLAGSLFHRTNHQVGVRIPTWGDGLLVVTDKPGSQTGGGGGSAILTTYGLDDAAFTKIEREWRSWWERRFHSAATEACQ
jgi:hypothetical protein